MYCLHLHNSRLYLPSATVAWWFLLCYRMTCLTSVSEWSGRLSTISSSFLSEQSERSSEISSSLHSRRTLIRRSWVRMIPETSSNNRISWDGSQIPRKKSGRNHLFCREQTKGHPVSDPTKLRSLVEFSSSFFSQSNIEIFMPPLYLSATRKVLGVN